MAGETSSSVRTRSPRTRLWGCYNKMLHFPLRKCYHVIKVGSILALVVTILSLFELWRGGKRSALAGYLDPEEAEFEKEILEDEARIIPGLGEGGLAANLLGEDNRLGEESEKKLAMNVYLSDRIPYNRTLKDFRNPACSRVVYDAELPSASVILIFHNEPYSVVIRTVWSVLNSVRRSHPWYRNANFIDRETGRAMNLGYPGQDPSSPFLYLKEIILVDDNSTLPELRGKLSHYVRTRLPPDLIRILRLPEREGLTRARHHGAEAALGDVLIFLDSHCETIRDWLRPLLQRIKDSRTAVVTPIIDMLLQRTFQYDCGTNETFEGLIKARLMGARAATGKILVFLDPHCETVRDWLRPLLHRIKENRTRVAVPVIETIYASSFFFQKNPDPDMQGLMLARMRGARAARGDALVFLDAHCEPAADWLRPLLQRLRHKRDSVLTPLIDVIDQTTFQLDAAQNFQVGGFTFVGHFTWIDVPEREKKRRGSDIAPTWSPTMAGGLFAINRLYYWELGAYDEQMAGWGGENLEMSFRIWQCGGTLETVPCSRVGHVFRAFHPYGMPSSTDTHGINTARMAEVWMDEYAELFYIHRPDLRNNPKIGDVTHRKVLREKLRCKSFQWYLDNIYKEKFVPVRDSYGYGRFRNPRSGLCLDTLQREAEGAALGVYVCHGTLQISQYFTLSLEGHLRDEEKCAQVHYSRAPIEESGGRKVLMMRCNHKTVDRWQYLPSKQLQHVASQLCLDAGFVSGHSVHASKCRVGAPNQLWEIDYTEDDDFRGKDNAEFTEQQLRLQKLRGPRRSRISRSLLSYNDEQGVGAAGVGVQAGAGADDSYAGNTTGRNERRHSHKKKKHKKTKKHGKKKRKSKKVKNKFILKLVRTFPNSSQEHLEVDVHCKHRQLYPNNSFVRDLVTILNEKDIKVINNGRVFERNKVTELEKEPHADKHREVKVLEKLNVAESSQGRPPAPQRPAMPLPPTVPAPTPQPAQYPPKEAKLHRKHKHKERSHLDPSTLLNVFGVDPTNPNSLNPPGAGGGGRQEQAEKKIIVEDFVEIKQTTPEPTQRPEYLKKNAFFHPAKKTRLNRLRAKTHSSTPHARQAPPKGGDGGASYTFEPLSAPEGGAGGSGVDGEELGDNKLFMNLLHEKAEQYQADRAGQQESDEQAIRPELRAAPAQISLEEAALQSREAYPGGPAAALPGEWMRARLEAGDDAWRRSPPDHLAHPAPGERDRKEDNITSDARRSNHAAEPASTRHRHQLGCGHTIEIDSDTGSDTDTASATDTDSDYLEGPYRQRAHNSSEEETSSGSGSEGAVLRSHTHTRAPVSPLKVVMRSNLTFNLGDEFFKWRADNDVADVLGELAIPGNSSVGRSAPGAHAWGQSRASEPPARLALPTHAQDEDSSSSSESASGEI